MKKKIAIIGAGFSGLTAALRLSQKKDCQVHLFEQDNKPGGLGRGYKQSNWLWSLEETYHHIFASDTIFRKLAGDMNIPIIDKRPITASFAHGNIYQLDSPLSLLTYPYLNLVEKLRTGLGLAYCKLTSNWQPLEKETAKNWLIKTQGKRAWSELWEPLFIGKFGKYSDKIAASWFWARIKKRSILLGYPKGGFQFLANKIAQQIKYFGGKIFYNSEVEKTVFDNQGWHLKINGSSDYQDYTIIVSTVPTPIFINIFSQLPEKYLRTLSTIPHLSCQTLILELKKPFLPFIRRSFSEGGPLNPPSKSPYWLNINDTSFPFLSLVEHTNFMDKKYYGGNYILYIGNYLPQNHQYLTMTKKELFNRFKPYLLKINPSYNFDSDLIGVELFSNPYAQPVIFTNYSQIRPSIQTPFPRLFFGNLDCVYPWDRGINYAIELGEKIANLC